MTGKIIAIGLLILTAACRSVPPKDDNRSAAVPIPCDRDNCGKKAL